MTTNDPATAEYIAFEEFREGLPRGRFRVVVDPALAPKFVAHRVHATAVGLALIGPGIVCALSGYPILGGLLVGAGILLRRAIKWQAAKILLHLATQQAEVYYDATAKAVMEVRRA
jgi:hypothetical protein